MSEGFYKGDTFRSSVDDTWTTPKSFYTKMHAEFNFTLDAAALEDSALCETYFGPDHINPDMRDALVLDWSEYAPSKTVWLNPPYGRGINAWVAKANQESKKGLTVVCLVPARTDTNWWWDSCIHHEVRFIKGRLKFGDGKNSAPFPSAAIIMKPTDLWGVVPNWIPRDMCKNGMPCHEAAPRGARTGTQGLKGARERSRVPYSLGEELLKVLEG